ncbi:DUF6529 family protein [Streptomyces sp. VRA16 Mangrove soil]|uniref:DUF6529 family protein n=1 Tax=Streptomyces sp. VRA16 Mangrove soil TaxID=2817434 RepID=UPI001A9DBD00|nr:DUF6529 family protein [Streptomyces sp. VRA16 Mangrove soil]MBO1332008.1 hypothetical protein [Streptomyces sp. VRA16 Mangrove soil]
MPVDPTAATQSFPAPDHRRPSPARFLAPALVAAAVAVALGVYGRVHDPAGTAFNLAGFSSTSAVKSWLATVAFAFALVQVVSAFMVYGKLRGPSWAPALHRWSGRIAFLVAVPVAVHCLYALGYQTYSTRVMWHSFLGCFFFGAFSAKMLLLRAERLPGWLLPVIGGLAFAVLTLLWLTSALWFFRTVGVTT